MLIFQGETLFETQNLSWFEEEFRWFGWFRSPESFLGSENWGIRDVQCGPILGSYRIPTFSSASGDFYCSLCHFHPGRAKNVVPGAKDGQFASNLRCLLAQHAPKIDFLCFKISNSLAIPTVLSEVVAAFCAQFLLHFNIANFVEPIVFGQSEELF